MGPSESFFQYGLENHLFGVLKSADLEAASAYSSETALPIPE